MLSHMQVCATVCVCVEGTCKRDLSTVKIGHRAVRNYNKCILSRAAAFQRGLHCATPLTVPAPPRLKQARCCFARSVFYI